VTVDGPVTTARLVVLSGPSGVGKSTVVSHIRAHSPEVWLSVSATTRRPRPGEIDGRHYLFIDDAEFDRRVQAGEFLEWATFAGHRYGTPAAPVRQRLSNGQSVLLEIDIQGAMQVRAADPAALLVFLTPPSWDVLVERLRGRGTEPEEVIAARLRVAEAELASAAQFDLTLVNSSIEEVAQRLVSLATAD
jgi:guanylate kinase